MAYLDRADWHYGGEYPAELPPENGGTHIGMFLAWAIINGLEGEDHRELSPDDLAKVRRREATGREFLFAICDEKFGEADLSEDGFAFAGSYYTGPDGTGYGDYITDYQAVLDTDSLPSLYHVADTWENYDKLAPVIDRRYADWKRTWRKK